MTKQNTIKSRKNVVLLFAMCLMLCFALCACSSTGSDSESADTSSSAETAAAESGTDDADQTEEETEEAEDVNTSDGTDTSEAETAANDGTISYDEEDLELLEAFGDDLHVVAEEDFLELVAEISADPDAYVGQVYQVTGYYLTALADEGEASYICQDDEDGNAAGFTLRYLSDELTEGQWYCITAIVAEEEHDEHSHLLFDVVAVESVDGH